jgi:uncharacterized protein YabE (DUF348 family)
MKTKTRNLIGIGGILILIFILILVIPRKVMIKINGQEQSVSTYSWTVEKVLQKGGLLLKPEDQVRPALQRFMLGVDQIEIELAREVSISVYPLGTNISLLTAERSLSALLSQAGVSAAANDRIRVNQQNVSLSATLPYTGAYFIEIKKAVSITVMDGESSKTLQSSADTLAEALSSANIQLAESDWMSLPGGTLLDQNLNVSIRRARPVTFQLKDESVQAQSALLTVGEALAEAGISLQNLDYSVPGEEDPIPADGKIQVIRVREEVNQTQTPIPFTVENVQSDQVELDKTEVVVPGEYGLEVTRTRIRYEDELETSRSEEVTWVAKQPVTQQVGRGTQVVIQTLDTPEGQIEYWRTVNVYVTSYSPCRSGTDQCYYGTSSGLPVQHGVVGVTRAWYNLMVGQRIYVPNYGIATIADVGGGVSGQYWIDLGYTDADYVAWSSNTTIYFLTPVPDNIPWILP